MAATTRFISLVYVLLWTAILCFSLSSFTLYKDSVTCCYKKPSRLSRHLVHTCVNPASVSTLCRRVRRIKSSPVMSLEARVLLFFGYIVQQPQNEQTVPKTDNSNTYILFQDSLLSVQWLSLGIVWKTLGSGHLLPFKRYTVSNPAPIPLFRY